MLFIFITHPQLFITLRISLDLLTMLIAWDILTLSKYPQILILYLFSSSYLLFINNSINLLPIILKLESVESNYNNYIKIIDRFHKIEFFKKLNINIYTEIYFSFIHFPLKFFFSLIFLHNPTNLPLQPLHMSISIPILLSHPTKYI